MKSIIGWVKSNLVIVILSVLMVASLPTAWFFAHRWNKSIRDGQQEQVNKDVNALKASKVTYSIKPGLPGVADIEKASVVPNDRLTEWFTAQKARLAEEGKTVVTLAQELNAKGRDVLVPGLFPEPAPSQRDMKCFDFVRAIIPDPANPSAYERLLREVNAGPPADSRELGAALRDAEAQWMERYKAEHGVNAKPTKEEEEEMRKELVAKRIGEYQRHANDISMYAGMDSLVLGEVPTKMPGQPPSVDQCFEWQFDYWVVGEALRAIAAANVRPDGTRTGVDESVVKRVVRLAPNAWDARGEGRSISSEDAPVAEGGDLVPLDKGHSITGRRTSPSNKVYDVRTVEASLIVSASRLPELLDAVSRDRFVTVLDCDISKADPWADLDVGYYYGNESVAKVDLVLETVWLRSWLEPLMPESVKVDVGIVAGAEDEDAPAPDRERAAPRAPAKSEKKPAPKSAPPKSRRGEDLPGPG